MPVELLWFALFIWIGFTTEVATGFGSIVIALALGVMILPIEAMLPVLVTLNVLMNTLVLSRAYQDIDKTVFFKQIFPLMLLGMAAGIALFPVLPEQILKTGFAVLIIWFAGKELIVMHGSKVQQPSTAATQSVFTLAAGVTHGLYASGGPLLVYGLSRTGLNKTAFRATLLATWWSLNLCYAIWFAFNGALFQHVYTIAAMLPVLLLAIVAGQFLHHRINEQQFKKVIYALLLVCGFIMLIMSLT